MSVCITETNKKVKMFVDELFFNVDVARQFKNRLMKCLLEDVNQIILDLSKVKLLDSIAVGILVHAQTICIQENITFTIINVHPDIMELIKQVKLDKILTISSKPENIENINN